MFKKIVVSLSLVVVLSLTGCAKTGNAGQNNAGQNNQVESSEPVDYAAQLEEINTAVKEAYGENYLANTEIDAATLESVYGITEDMYDAVIAQGPLMSVHVDTFIGIHPAEGKKDAVVEALTAYRDYQINQAMNYPMNLGKIQASEVKEIGDYVFFIMLGTTDEMFDTEEEEIAAFQELNQVAVDAINGVLNK